MNISQLQKLFHILCLLAFEAEQNASVTVSVLNNGKLKSYNLFVQEDLKIRIMKLLASDSVK